MKLSIALPCYTMRGLGAGFLRHSLDILCTQTFKDFEVVITDNSEQDTAIEEVVKEYQGRLNIKYSRNPFNCGLTGNTNRAIANCTGEIIKTLFLDDFIYSNDSLEAIVNAFTPETKWLVTCCEHYDDRGYYREFYPYYNEEIYLGNNTLSSPSSLAFRNEGHLTFDENLTWMMDSDYYKRCYDAFGLPTILDKICVANRTGKHQTTSSMTEEQKKKEIEYCRNKHETPTS